MVLVREKDYAILCNIVMQRDGHKGKLPMPPLLSSNPFF